MTQAHEKGTKLAQSTTIETPDGPFSIIASAHAVLASGWTDDPDYLLALIHTDLRPARVDLTNACELAPDSVLAQAAAAVIAYYEGDVAAVRKVAVDQRSGEFRMLAWEKLREVEPGHPISYTEYAARCGNDKAARAVASACSCNAVALFVPCHRITRSDGSVGEFRYGPDIKKSLLAREAYAESRTGAPTENS